MVDKTKILSFLEATGPTLPAKVAKYIGTDILFASAALSELVSGNEARITFLKIGGSPLYYLSGQEPMLQNFSKNLHEKERKAYALLVQEQVLEDKKLEPVIRVALRNMKDYAKPLTVERGSQKEIFWKWYLLGKEEAAEKIKSILKIHVVVPKPIDNVPITPEIASVGNMNDQSVQKSIEREKVVESKSIVKPKPLTKTSQVPSPKPVVKISDNKLPATQHTLMGLSDEEKGILESATAKDPFLKKVRSYFDQKHIEILSFEKKKKADYDCIILLPSPIGNIRYFASIKGKKRLNEGDLSTVYVQAQINKLPALLLSSGIVPKKLESKLNKEFRDIMIKTI